MLDGAGEWDRDRADEEGEVSKKPTTESLVAWIFPPDTQPVRCPRGHVPSLEQDHVMSHFACRRWFDLRACCEGPKVFEGRGDGKYAWNAAARAWNRWIASKAGAR